MGRAWALNTPHRGRIRTSGGPRRQQQTAATILPPVARGHPVSNLRPAQMTAIDLPATRSHRGDHMSPPPPTEIVGLLRAPLNRNQEES
jgi:hypothetical protein